MTAIQLMFYKYHLRAIILNSMDEGIVMKIVGGSFGIKGSAYVAGSVFAVEGATKKDYRSNEIASVDARVEKKRSFGIVGFIVGAVLFTIIGMMVFGFIGGLIGFILSVAGSFYTTKTNVVDVSFTDGKTLAAEGTDRSIRNLVKFADK